ncbi:MAG TPA: hypothetical protein VFB16_07860 [Bauldia sp.]|nr:hypothetical protein [Bauldia sp.]
MDLHGVEYFYTLSLIAVTFAVVSALVMLLRQSMGGKLSNFDIYLTGAYVRFGFGLTIAAILPTLLILFEPTPPLLWGISGLLAAAIVGGSVGSAVRHRRLASQVAMSWGVAASFLTHMAVAIFLVALAFVPVLQTAGFYGAAITLSLADVMWTFVRRITSLLGSSPGSDWDPRRG